MDTQAIQELIDIMNREELTALRVDDGEIKIELERSRSPLPASTLPLMAERAAQLLTHDSHIDEVPKIKEEDSAAVFVRSPMVGTFYVAPSPDEDPFVQVGQEIQAGQTLAIVEAMKMMNEIIAEKGGVVLEVLAANATQVEYDQPLFRLTAE